MTLSSDRQLLSGWRKPAACPGALDDCTLLVPTYKRPREMVLLLDTVLALAEPPGEVVVIDGSPGSEAAEAIAAWARSRQLPFDLVLVCSPAGLTLQRNVGLDVCTREFIFYLDDDCLPQPGYFRAMREVFVRSGPEVGAVMGTAVNLIGRSLPSRWRWRLALGIVPRIPSGTYYPTATTLPERLPAPFSGTRPVDSLSGGIAAYRRVVLETHRFSRFFYGYAQGEDFEMSLRIGRTWKLLWCGDAHVIHNHAEGGRPPSAEKGRMEVRNRFFIWKRYSPSVPFGIRVRFWADMWLGVAIDVGTFLRHPRQWHHLNHARGLLAGMLSCWFNPPRYDEPPARHEYAFDLRPLGTRSGPHPGLSHAADRGA